MVSQVIVDDVVKCQQRSPLFQSATSPAPPSSHVNLDHFTDRTLFIKPGHALDVLLFCFLSHSQSYRTAVLSRLDVVSEEVKPLLRTSDESLVWMLPDTKEVRPLKARGPDPLPRDEPVGSNNSAEH